MDQLQQLKKLTQVVADTGDIEAIKRYQPVDATTNPSLLLKAAGQAQYQPLLDQSCLWAADYPEATLSAAATRFAVLIGREISGIVPGYISTEVDARLSFNTQATVEKAQSIINQYQALGVGKERILIKIASTWEGIKAAEQLEAQGISCNLTLLFSFTQAVACANAGATLISPFVGRILDWHKANGGEQHYEGHLDPGVLSVKAIYEYYKHHSYNTIVMGASFRNIDEIRALAGCDRLTISPVLLQALEDSNEPLTCALDSNKLGDKPEKISLSEDQFRFSLNEDAMATEKLAQGIRQFVIDQIALEQLLADRML